MITNRMHWKGMKFLNRIGITCTTIFHYIHFRYIAEELSNHGYQVKYIIYTPKFTNNRYEKLYQYFTDNSIPFCDFEELFQKENFDIILAPYFMPGFQLLSPEIKKVRVLYGYAKDRWNYAEWNEGFDLILAYGPYSEERLSRYANVISIGHPRYRQSYLKNLTDITGKQFVKIHDKPVLLYCPTWNDLSSLNLFVKNKEIFEREFTVIVKLHHGNVLSDNQQIWKSLKLTSNVYLFDECTDLFDLLAQCDIVLSDYSGAIFDAMLFRKPIVLLDSLAEDINDTGNININKMRNIAKYNREIENNVPSLDIAVRQYLPHANNFAQLIELLKQQVREKNISYEHLIPKLYSYEDHLAPQRAVKALESLKNSKSDIKVDRSFYIIDEEKIINFVKKNKGREIAIWGAGEIGQIVSAWLKKQGVIISCFMDIDPKKQGKIINGIKVIPIDTKKKILITAANYQKEITQKLLNQGLRINEDFISVFR